MQKQRIVFCMNQIVMGGIEKILLQYLSELRDKYDITVLSRHKVSDKYFLDYFTSNGIHLIDDISVHPEKHIHFFLWKILLKPIRILTRKRNNYQYILNKFDIIIDFCNFSFEPELRNINKTKIAWCHGSILFFNRNNLIQKLSSYDKLVCLSDNFLNAFIDIYPEHKNKIVRLYNPLNITEIQHAAKKQTPPNEKYFIHVSRLDGADKDLITVIKAFDLFYKKNQDVKLYIVGDGVQKEHLEQLAANNPNIVFCGRIDEPYYLISGALALILSSSTTIGEGLPVVLTEAQILQTLAISSNVPSGPSEILLNGDAGILFPPKDYETLSKILLDVVENPKKYENQIKNATKNLYRFDVRNIDLQKVLKTSMKK
ncbi:MAG: glycosyltransferase [Alphaproteobacteria bacterium]|nr:glycosyltransferase [Alphaproteobacteria bacterium]